MKQNKGEIDKNPSKDKKESTFGFCWLCQSVRSKKKTQPKAKMNNSKENNLHLSICDNENKQEKLESIHVIDNNKETITKPENDLVQNELLPIDQLNNNRETICKTEEKDKRIIVYESDNDKESIQCVNEIIETKSNENNNQGSKEKITLNNADTTTNPIQQNLELKFNLVSNDKKQSCIENNRIAMTEETPRKFNHSVFNHSTIQTQKVEAKNCQTNRDKQIGINMKDEAQKNTDNDLQGSNPQVIIKEKNGIEFAFKRKDSQAIHNEIVHPQVEVKQFIASTINEPYTKMQDKISSIPNIIGKASIDNNPTELDHHHLNSNHNKQSNEPLNQIETTKPTLNYINDNEDDLNADMSIGNDESYCVDEDDQDMKSKNDNVSKYSETQSVVSSYVFTVPKMITGINDSYTPSVYTRSEYKDNTSNFLPTEGSQNFKLIPHNADDTEFEITNENGEGFRNFIETPRVSNLNFKKSIGGTLPVNPQFKTIHDKINHKEKEIKRINDKIAKMMAEIQQCEEENKKYDRWIEKEELEGEMLRHMLNYQSFK